MKKYLIDIKALSENIDLIIKEAAPAKVIGVLKGNGYGLGIVPFAMLLEEHGIEVFAVAELDEAITLRNAGISREIILLSSTAVQADAEIIAQLDITATIGSEEAAYALCEAGRMTEQRINAHIKVDTGFGRFGFMPGSEETVARVINSLENVTVKGIYTHLSFSFEKNNSWSLKQKQLFEDYVDNLDRLGICISIKHIANSCAFLRWPDFRMDAVRVGSAFLGRLPISTDLPLNQIGKLVSQLIEIKKLPKGHNVGYANTLFTSKETTIGIVPVGYKDGFGVERQKDTFRLRDTLRYMLSSLFSKPQTVSVNGKRAPLLGRIGMYNIIVDLTEIDAAVGDEVILQCNPILLDGSVERVYE